jgi:hypothetical protein
MKFPLSYLPHQMAQSYPIPRTLWESLDAILFSKGMALAKEIATEMGVQPQALISSLNTQERSKFTIVPDEETSMYQCQALIQHGATYLRCRCPSLKPAPSYCLTHEKHSLEIKKTLPFVKRVITPEETLVEREGVVYGLSGKRRGLIKGTRITLFEIDP